MKFWKPSLIFATLFLLVHTVFAQNGTQTIRGTILDKQSEMPLIGVAVEVLNLETTLGTTANIEGSFEIQGVPVGRQTLRFSYLGYNTITIPNVIVTSGKEVIMDVSMEESVIEINEVVVTAEVEKDKASNELATISARAFTLEEVTRYSGARNDVSRMVANYAGVNIADDSRNDIVIRGNSPTGVLWRLEGVPIPNPNHFHTLGTTGGPVSALNTNLLKNSDFMTSAFPAEYGNALAGVFDIGFRSGNKEKYEFTAQLAAFSGLEFMAEGPLTKKKNSSFVVSYRHSFVELADQLGLFFGTSSIPNYKDLSFKIDLPHNKYGKFSFFGIGGMSDINFIGKDLSDEDFYGERDENSYITSKLGIIGINHRLLLGESTYVRTTLSASTSQNTYDEDFILEDETAFRHVELEDINDRYSISSYLNKKFNAKTTLRVGFLGEYYRLNTYLQSRENRIGWEPIRDFDGGLGLFQVYAQSQYRLNEKWTLNGGLHGQYLTFNDSWAIEPRAAINFHVTPNQTISLGYGLHNQMQPLPMYFYESPLSDGTFIQSNKELDFTSSNQLVLAYDLKLGTDWRIKTEAYYQALRDAPVRSVPASFSVLNVGADFVFPEEGFLVNDGKGENYGFEMTIEKFFSRGYYGLLTASIFDSNYEGSDGIKRNTAFNNGYTFNFLAGKEFKIGKDGRNAITFDAKLTSAGGRYFIPIDLEASKIAMEEVEIEELAFSERFDPYFRLDVKIGYRLNSKKRKLSQQFYLDFQNITNRENIFTYRFNRSQGEIQEVNQIGFFPDILYRVQF